MCCALVVSSVLILEGQTKVQKKGKRQKQEVRSDFKTELENTGARLYILSRVVRPILVYRRKTI
jgi:hypothetical protein